MIEPVYLEAIKEFEGFTPRARWDYAQFSNGFGTRARTATEVIDAAEADRRFRSEISEAAVLVDKFAPGLSDGARAALTSLTFNAGTAWMRGTLGQAIARGDLQTARDIFLKYDNAGGERLPGLSLRRAKEASWFIGENSVSEINRQNFAPDRSERAEPFGLDQIKPAASHKAEVCVLAEPLAVDPPPGLTDVVRDNGSIGSLLLEMLDILGRQTPERQSNERNDGALEA